jgi:hypothetical protein
MEAHTPSPGDADARRGLELAIIGPLLVPVTVGVVAVAPQHARVWIFVIGSLFASATALSGGAMARRALNLGTERRAVAYAGALGGFIFGVTIALVALSSVLGLLA